MDEPEDGPGEDLQNGQEGEYEPSRGGGVGTAWTTRPRSRAIQGTQNTANPSKVAWRGSRPLTSMLTSTASMAIRWRGTK